MADSLKFLFSNRKAMEYFKQWFSNIGEQEYWNYMEIKEKKHKDKNITAIMFRYNEDIIYTIDGRLDEPE